jgi:hypothetical protein
MLRFLNYTFSKKNKNILAFLVQNTHYLSSKIIIALNFKKIAILPPPPKKKIVKIILALVVQMPDRLFV